MKLDEIPQFPRAAYEVDVSWVFLEQWLEMTKPPINLEPDYQRGHVWSPEQQRAYVEYVLMGGEVAKNITTNCPGWSRASIEGPYELVDGLQRITAVRRFMRNEMTVFDDTTSRETLGGLRFLAGFKWRVLDLPTRADVLRLYLLINAGGTPHSPEEIARIRGLLSKEAAHAC